MLVKVAIDLSLDRLFTYEVPVELSKEVRVGQLVEVPFGHQTKRGFVLELDGRSARGSDPTEVGREGSGTPFKIKPIGKIVDPVPFFSEKLLELIKQIAAYTAAPIESVLRAAVPAAVIKPNAHPKELLFVSPVIAPAPNDLTKKQQWLYEQVVRLHGGWMTQLCHELGTTPATMKVLAQKGFVIVEPRQRYRTPLSARRVLPTRPLALNDEQRVALDVITSDKLQVTNGGRKPILLHGVTGSGKTEVYLQAIAKIVESGHGAIVMVPEISLTPQTVQRFASRFGERVAVLHSALSDGERYDEWHRIRSGKAQVVIGPRSAVFAPVQNLGLIVVDEEHDGSYKQEDNPRYNARDAAVLRAKIEGAAVVLGSATPSLETYYNAQTGKYTYIRMKERAGAGTLPNIRLVDLGEGGTIYSPDLLEAIRLRLDRAEQTILFLNRRGYSRSVTCLHCGATVDCDRCDMPYTYHKADNCLRCHICGGWTEIPRKCPKCGSDKLTYKGIGTQRAEAALRMCFPHARILRMDADSTSRKNSHDDILGSFRRHEADILLGTQMIAKGLDFPNVTLVGVLNADSALNMPDFRAAERAYQLLAQVAGRAGRAELPGEVIIQTRNPGHFAIKAAFHHDYEEFARQELNDRKEGNLPPYSHLSLISLKSEDQSLVANWAEMYAESLAKFGASEAMPSAIEKADGWYRYQIIFVSKSVSTVLKAYRKLLALRPPPSGLKVGIDIDAQNLM